MEIPPTSYSCAILEMAIFLELRSRFSLDFFFKTNLNIRTQKNAEVLHARHMERNLHIKTKTEILRSIDSRSRLVFFYDSFFMIHHPTAHMPTLCAKNREPGRTPCANRSLPRPGSPFSTSHSSARHLQIIAPHPQRAARRIVPLLGLKMIEGTRFFSFGSRVTLGKRVLLTKRKKKCRFIILGSQNGPAGPVSPVQKTQG